MLSDPIEKLLEPQTFERLAKLIEASPTLEKIFEKLRELDTRGQLDTLLNIVDQGVSLIDAIQKADLINTLVAYGLDQISKLQTIWPLIEKLTSEKTFYLIQKIDLDSLLNTLDRISPMINKLTSEKTVKIIEQLDLDGLLESTSKLIPVLNKLTSEKTVKILTSLNYDSIISTIEKITPTINKLIEVIDRLQSAGKLDNLINVTEQTIDLIDAVIKTDLINTLVSYSIDLLPTFQSLWSLIQKFSDQKLIDLLKSMDIESLVSSINRAQPVIEKFTAPEVVKTLSEIDVNSLVKTLRFLTELQRSGTLDTLLGAIKTLTEPENVKALEFLSTKFSQALKSWYKELPTVRPASIWSLIRPDKDTSYAIGALVSLLRELGKVMKQ
jgi:uncharacterized protein YjgD (DUF1641 family)